MVDLETLGTRPDRNFLLSMAVVAFDKDTMEFDPEGIEVNFNKDQPFRTHDPDTVSWWLTQPKEAQDAAFKGWEDMSVTNLQQVDKIIDYVAKYRGGAKDIFFWSKPLHFDFMFTAGFFKDVGTSMIFPHYLSFDMRSYCIGMLGGKDHKYYDLQPAKREGAHQPLSDCYWQLEWMKACIEESKNATQS
jgi:hypothetical protein